MATISDQNELLTLFQDNSAGDISAGDSRDLIVSCVHNLPSGQAGENLIIPETASVVGLAVQAQTSQTADLVDFNNSSGTVLAGVNAACQFFGDGSQLTGIVSGQFFVDGNNNAYGSNSTIDSGSSYQANVGLNSTSSSYSTAFGYGNTVSGGGVAVGNTNTVSGYASTLAAGFSNTLSGGYSFALGSSNSDAGFNAAVLLGNGNTATADSQFWVNGVQFAQNFTVDAGQNAYSSNSTISGHYNQVAIGQASTGSSSAIAIGYSAKADTNSSIAIGYACHASGTAGVCIGSSVVDAGFANCVVLGSGSPSGDGQFVLQGNVGVSGTATAANTLTIVNGIITAIT